METILDIQKVQVLDNLEFVAKQIVEGFITGLHKSPFHGFSVEFAEHRIYNTGESTRHIDWKLYARTDKLFVKKYEEETNLRCQIVIDASSSMLFPLKEKGVCNKLQFSVYCAAALIYLLRSQRDAVGMSLFSDKIDLHTVSRLSDVHARMLFSHLEDLMGWDESKLNRKTKASDMLHQIADNVHKRSLVIIFSDMFDNEEREELYSALQHLRYNKHEVIIFHVKDGKKEQQFDYNSRPYKFIDMETGDEVKLNPNEIRDNYIRIINDWNNELIMRCGQYDIDLVEADINGNFKNVLMPYLLKRSKLF
ncbi:MAG: hypothetical protein A2275_16795 [Bacteroidetes bacterium RIFOXYA12_FULL_35_11]|nr:MAG: hypothetical protein A2X01_03165 [Bacteroidetes bacterium GWF2_35_48]OFY82463.1 MAG: hypothetical protein A2275_16795 [Bacteroidetes bacterium RIFOXYA12_FULL_35_11]OFZ02689.1 MAG: hypothetical protein A2491_06990 [Bacteroidetes bacterium RIFOXYC12_FULL_35_7]HBX51422.1 DUF58 domain-containing protein [Bacteroidales bacterium]